MILESGKNKDKRTRPVHQDRIEQTENMSIDTTVSPSPILQTSHLQNTASPSLHTTVSQSL